MTVQATREESRRREAADRLRRVETVGWRTVGSTVALVSGSSLLVVAAAASHAFTAAVGDTLAIRSIVLVVLFASFAAGASFAARRLDSQRFRAPRARALLESAAFIGAISACVAPRWLAPLAALGPASATTLEGFKIVSFTTHALDLFLALLALGPFAAVAGVRAALDGQRGLQLMGAAIGLAIAELAAFRSFGFVTAAVTFAAASLAASAIDAMIARPRADEAAADPRSDRAIDRPSIAVFVASIGTFGILVTWLRFLVPILGLFRSVYATIVIVLVLGMGIGAVIADRLRIRFGRPAIAFIIAESAFAAAAVGLPFAYKTSWVTSFAKAFHDTHAVASPLQRALIEHAMTFRAVLLVLAVPALLAGAALPLLTAEATARGAARARAFGTLLAAEAAGAALGYTSATFLLMPEVGLQVSAAMFAVVCALAIVPMYNITTRRVFAWCFLASSLALARFGMIYGERLLMNSFSLAVEPQDIFVIREGSEETSMVTTTGRVDRAIISDGYPSSATIIPAQRCLRALAHVPLLQIEDPKRVLIVRFGTGLIAHAASLHPSVESIEVVDPSADAFAYGDVFDSTSHGVIHDPRVSLHVDSVRHHLAVAEPTYDLIAVEPPLVGTAGASLMYSRELYALARSRLREGGYFAERFPAYRTDALAVRAIVRAFVEVFPSSVLLAGWGRELILLGTTAPKIELDIDRLTDRLDERPMLRADLEAIMLGRTNDIAGMFVASSDTMQRATRDVAPSTDDWAVAEFGLRSRLGRTELPAELFNPKEAGAWCPKCSGVDAELEVAAAIYATDSYRQYVFRPALHGAFDVANSLSLDRRSDEQEAAIVESAYLTQLVPDPSRLRARARLLIDKGDATNALRVLEKLLAMAPSDCEGHVNIGRVYAIRGTTHLAVAHWERAKRLAQDPARRQEIEALIARTKESGVQP